MSEGRYDQSSPWGRIRIASSELAEGVTLEQYAAHVRDNLEREWWPTRSLFEVTSFQERQIEEQDFYAISYRVRESPEYCIVDVAELVAVPDPLPGTQRGFRIRIWMCDYQVPSYGSDRTQILDSFRVIAQPAAYYTQFLTVKGITIKGNDEIDSDAFYAAADMISPMLSGREDIVECMADVGGDLAIIPKDEKIITLPEFRFLEGRKTFDGRSYESVRGGGAVKGREITVTSEEGLLGLRENPYRHIALVTVHEFAHSIQNLCFTAEDHEEWNAFYDAAVGAGFLPGEYLMSNEREFFAVFSTAYFEVTAELGPNTSRNLVETNHPKIFEFLDEIYGGAHLSLESKRLTPR